MIQSFRHKGLERFYSQGSKSGILPSHAGRLEEILATLEAATAPQDLGLPGLRLHALSGNRQGYWAVRVSGAWRVIFRFEEHHVCEVDYLQYH